MVDHVRGIFSSVTSPSLAYRMRTYIRTYILQKEPRYKLPGPLELLPRHDLSLHSLHYYYQEIFLKSALTEDTCRRAADPAGNIVLRCSVQRRMGWRNTI